jgi:hypothetical protein
MVLVTENQSLSIIHCKGRSVLLEDPRKGARDFSIQPTRRPRTASLPSHYGPAPISMRLQGESQQGEKCHAVLERDALEGLDQGIQPHGWVIGRFRAIACGRSYLCSSSEEMHEHFARENQGLASPSVTVGCNQDNSSSFTLPASLPQVLAWMGCWPGPSFKYSWGTTTSPPWADTAPPRPHDWP